MRILGADPDQLMSTAQRVGALADTYEDSTRQIGYWLQRIDWDGPEAQRFRALYESRMRPRLDEAAGLLRETASELRSQADEQIRVSQGRLNAPTDGSANVSQDAFSPLVGFFSNARDFFSTRTGKLVARGLLCAVVGVPAGPRPRPNWEFSFTGGKKWGMVAEYIPEFEVSRTSYANSSAGDTSVLVASKFGVDVGDLEGLLLIRSAGKGLGKLAAQAIDTYSLDLHLDGSAAAGLGYEYRWYDTAKSDEIYNHFQKLAGEEQVSWGTLGQFDMRDIQRAIEDRSVPRPDSQIFWLTGSVELSGEVSYGHHKLPFLGAGVEGSARTGVEVFRNGETASVVNFSLAGSLEAGWFAELTDRYKEECTVSGEIQMIRDEAGNPKTLHLSATASSISEASSGLVVSETSSEGEHVTATYEFDLRDPMVQDALSVGPNTGLTSVVPRALENLDLAVGERHLSESSSGGVVYDLLFSVGADQEGSTSQIIHSEIKPAGSSDWQPWDQDVPAFPEAEA